MINSHSTEVLTLTEEKTETEVIYSLLIYNDDFNTFQHVISCLVKICDHNPLQAEQCSLIIHHNGKCVVKSGSFEKLEPMCTALLDKGLSAKIEK
jgi:ATP-dependent Clp protease adaptor protein ClpS